MAADSSTSLGHPLVIPLPRLIPPTGSLLRRLVLGRLRSAWSSGRLDLSLPTGQIIRLGDRHGRADATASIHDDRLFLRMLLRGELGAGESYVAGEWSSDDVVGVIRLFLRATGANGLESPLTRLAQLPTRLRHQRSANTRAGSRRNIHAHYDLGNEFYQLFLDADTLAYSCALWKPGVTDLAEAQRAKLERMCELLELGPDDRVLEIGCGWGGFAIHAARTRGCRVTAITISHEQHRLARERVAAAGLADRIDVQFRDYRNLERGEQFDKIASIEMLEAVGYEYLPDYFATCARVLRGDGRIAIQTITIPDARFERYRRNVDWMQTYIFPGSLIPSLGAIGRASDTAGLRVVEAHDIGPDYAPTLRAWRERFVAAMPRVRELGFDPPFVRTWRLYLAFSEAAFAERTLADHQLVLAHR